MPSAYTAEHAHSILRFGRLAWPVQQWLIGEPHWGSLSTATGMVPFEVSASG